MEGNGKYLDNLEMFVKWASASSFHHKPSFASIFGNASACRPFTTPAQNAQFRTRNVLLSKQKPVRTQDYKLINPQLEAYKRDSKRMLKEYWFKYAVGKDRRVEAGKVRREKRKGRDGKWEAYEGWMEGALNPTQHMTGKRKQMWERERGRIERERVKKGERGKIRLYLQGTPVVQQRQKIVAHLLQMAESGQHFITTMEQAEKAIKHALAKPTNCNLPWDKIMEHEGGLKGR